MIRSFRKLLELNTRTGIHTRAFVAPFGYPLREEDTLVQEAPKADLLNHAFREHATQLSVGACEKALAEWGGSKNYITHVIAVTCTDAGSPGFDEQVVNRLSLPRDVDRMLLHGVGCAGGLALLRAARQVANGASFNGMTANILLLSCEITSIYARTELDAVDNYGQVGIGPILFGDAAAAMVLTNDPHAHPCRPVYELVETLSSQIPDSESAMSYLPTAHGKRA